MPIGEVEYENMEDILADVQGQKYNWFTCHLLRLIARADSVNRRLLAKAYPEEVMAYERWHISDFGKRDHGKPIELTIHIIHHGQPLCGFSSFPPGDWPSGHKWVDISEADRCTCRGCRNAVILADKKSLKR